MRNLKKWFVLGTAVVMTFSLAACSGKSEGESDGKEEKKEEKKEIAVATTAIPAKILEAAKEEYEAMGYKLDIQIMDDVFTQNVATEEGSVEANFYQYEPFMDSYNEEKGTHLVSAGRKYYDIPLSVYSEKYGNLDELPDGAKIGIYSDASTKARCLQLLEDDGLIELEDVDEPTVLDIASNPKNVEFVELDSDAKLTASLSDLDAATIYKQGMVLAEKDASSNIAADSTDDTYAIILVVKEGNEDAQWLKDLDKALTSDKVRDFINNEFEGALKPLF